ncbi:MAG: hypothetical protein CMF38_00430 [Legionellaceae bacterium]|nr:hypothetical protein [Legionellaceae bacterium]HAF87206.1 hypothetical protein [Legionellales bacterium]HCA89222.1 hypothetical protein [Legionellales bacterium]|tara:strand:- start:473 stop:2041 length:1569 start_codon:yes stop_codon:yes gene_type:complete
MPFLKQGNRVERNFLAIWLFFTLICLGAILCLQWHETHVDNKRDYQIEAHLLAYHLNNYTSDLLDTIQILAFKKINTDSCNAHQSTIRAMLFDNPTISGIVIADSHYRVLCSSGASNNQRYILPAQQNVVALLGPYQLLSHPDKPFFILQKKFNDSVIGVIILKSVLIDMINNFTHQFVYIGLYDEIQKKMLLSMGDPGYHTFNMSYFYQPQEINLHRLSQLTLIAYPPRFTFSKQILINALKVALPILFTSIILYSYCRRILRYRISLSYGLSVALQKKQFYPVYQAIWNNELQKFSAAEVLVRWKTSDGTIINPEQFIDEAEKTGLIVPITLQLVEHVFNETKSMLSAYPFFYLSFNIAPRHFYSSHFFEDFYKLCAEFGINPAQIMLELTERELFNHTDSAILERMQQLRQKGFHLAIDDFGTGQSNINYLHTFPFNYLKIDKLFVHSIGTGAVTEVLSSTIIEMANLLDLNIVAEGVEHKAQCDYLAQKGVKLLQGWFYTKPLVFHLFKTFIQTHNTR